MNDGNHKHTLETYADLDKSILVAAAPRPLGDKVHIVAECRVCRFLRMVRQRPGASKHYNADYATRQAAVNIEDPDVSERKGSSIGLP